ncbi:hypothetical protein Ctaglu_02770 [Clostridium tagluense]|uniref:Uncharacterized protein n=1 Tax=Clostridium tagluense TaxID=360422 RepID=A0A401UGM9_9CLOT|nr:hypothetical protein Ctaglu_02770 [Clostridium tagluense]
MLMKPLINIIMKLKNNIIFIIAIYTIAILGCGYIFLFQPDAKVTYIYNQF